MFKKLWSIQEDKHYYINAFSFFQNMKMSVFRYFYFHKCQPITWFQWYFKHPTNQTAILDRQLHWELQNTK